MRKLVIADAGPLIAFARLRQLELLAQMFDSVLITDEVIRECTCRSDFAILVCQPLAPSVYWFWPNTKKHLAAIKPLLDELTRSGYFLGESLIVSALTAVGE